MPVDFSPVDVLLLPLILVTVSTHEFSHGWMASKLGDPTAKERGRLTLNPLKHVSWKYTLVLPALLFIATLGRFAFGFAKPLPVNPFRLRSYERQWRRPFADMIWVGLIGPDVNLAIAGLMTLVVLTCIIPAETKVGWMLLELVYFFYGLQAQINAYLCRKLIFIKGLGNIVIGANLITLQSF